MEDVVDEYVGKFSLPGESDQEDEELEEVSLEEEKEEEEPEEELDMMKEVQEMLSSDEEKNEVKKTVILDDDPDKGEDEKVKLEVFQDNELDDSPLKPKEKIEPKKDKPIPAIIGPTRPKKIKKVKKEEEAMKEKSPKKKNTKKTKTQKRKNPSKPAEPKVVKKKPKPKPKKPSPAPKDNTSRINEILKMIEKNKEELSEWKGSFKTREVRLATQLSGETPVKIIIGE